MDIWALLEIFIFKSLSSKNDDKSYYAEVKNLKLKRKFFDNNDVKNKEHMLLGHYIWMVEKYRRIDDECLNYILYKDCSSMSLYSKTKIFMLEHKMIIFIVVMKKIGRVFHSIMNE